LVHAAVSSTTAIPTRLFQQPQARKAIKGHQHFVLQLLSPVTAAKSLVCDGEMMPQSICAAAPGSPATEVAGRRAGVPGKPDQHFPAELDFKFYTVRMMDGLRDDLNCDSTALKYRYPR